MKTQPTARDQYMLELINRARLNPQAEANQLLRGDLNEGITAGTIPAEGKQPLAFNPYLFQSARDHCQWMIDKNIFSHRGLDDSRVGKRSTSAGYAWQSVGENLGLRSTNGRLDLIDDVRQHYQNLFADYSIVGRGHRINMLKSEYKEAGVVLLDTNQGRNKTTLTCHVFGLDVKNDSFLTGVVYNDRVNRDNFYNVGEGLANITVKAVGKDRTYTTTTMNAGGYQLRLPPGSYHVTFSGNFQGHRLIETSAARSILIGNQNVKLDFVPDKSVAALANSGPIAGPVLGVVSWPMTLAVLIWAMGLSLPV
jgi:serralysin